jgi:hypothetical protein
MSPLLHSSSVSKIASAFPRKGLTDLFSFQMSPPAPALVRDNSSETIDPTTIVFTL